jgi:hypothetical protein
MKSCFISLFFGGILLLFTTARSQSIHGSVSDALSKKPIARAKISLIGVATTWSSDTLGNFTSDTVKPGTYIVKAEAPGFLKVTKKIILTSPQKAGTSDLLVNLSLYAIAENSGASNGSMVVQFNFPGHFPASIDIADAKGIVVKNAYDRSRSGGMRSYLWDGKDNNGKYTPAGRYTAKVVSGRLVMIRTLLWKGMIGETVKKK